MLESRHLGAAELRAGLDHIRQSPKDRSRIDLIVCRPATGDRKVLDTGYLDPAVGLTGDRWSAGDARPATGTQITIMNSRAVALVAQSKHRWPLAGDQLYADLDLSEANVPPGTRLTVGEAELEVSVEPHLGWAIPVATQQVTATGDGDTARAAVSSMVSSIRRC